MENPLSTYTFLPWLRQGIATEIPDVDNLNAGPSSVTERAVVDVRFKINSEPVSKPVKLIGPGDIIGISPRAIIKTEPRDWITDFESNYLPYIEFYEEDFPWRYTPANAAEGLDQSKLRPWIYLAVLKEDEFEKTKAGGPLSSIKILADPLTVFPKPEQSWAWAHVHVSKDVINADDGEEDFTKTEADAVATAKRLEDVIAENPDNAFSRLLSPRKLERDTAYHAFLIPAFEVGRLAGLGLPTTGVDGLAASLRNGETLFPYYFSWYFRTGAQGDFEFLVDLLEPRKIDKRVGIRDMDMQQPGFEVEGLADPFQVMGLEGALKSPETISNPTVWPPVPDNPSVQNFLTQLQEKVNLQQTSIESGHPDPIISPPLYGQWHSKTNKLDVENGQGWVHQLNRDPRLRVASGLGTKVIQWNQEDFMQRAWSQLGDLLPANQRIRQFQVGLMSAYRMYLKHLKPLPDHDFLILTKAVHAKILGSPTTIAQQVKVSRLPQAALDPAFRRITRTRGAIMKKLASKEFIKKNSIISQLNAGQLTAAPLVPPSKKLITVSNLSTALVPENTPEWLKQLASTLASRWVLGAMILILLFAMILTGSILVLGAAALGAAGILVATERLRPRLRMATAFEPTELTPEKVDSIPSRPNFRLAEFGQTTAQLPASSSSVSNINVEERNYREGLKANYKIFQDELPLPAERQPLSIKNATLKVKTAINPIVAIPKRARFILKIPDSLREGYRKPVRTIVTIMAHPVLTEPMYKPLKEISSELLIPNLNLISNNTISLMVVNRPFIESYMVGLNHEMSRELLWREFPTDQRGTYFRQFWDVSEIVNRDANVSQKEFEEELLDIDPIHTWGKNNDLGDNDKRGLPIGNESDPEEPKIVLVIRGDLLKKYPTTVIFAQRARWVSNEDDNMVRVLDERDNAKNVKTPVFKASVEPDLHFLGFDMVRSEVEGHTAPLPVEDADAGWFFVLQQRPGEPRFGLDNKSEETPDSIINWNDLSWEHLANFDSLGFIDFEAGFESEVDVNRDNGELPDRQFHWGRNAADVANILYQVPVMVAFHAADMLKGTEKSSTNDPSN